MNKAASRKFLWCIFALVASGIQPACTQDLVLLDRKWKQPVQLIDSVTLQVLLGGSFPIYKSDLDRTITILEHILEKGVQEQDFEYYNHPLPIEGTQVVGQLSNRAKHRIFLKTRVGNYTTFMDLISGSETPFQKGRKLFQLLDYLKNNRSLLK